MKFSLVDSNVQFRTIGGKYSFESNGWTGMYHCGCTERNLYDSVHRSGVEMEKTTKGPFGKETKTS